MSSPEFGVKALGTAAGVGIISLVAGASVMLFLFDPNRYPFYPICLFHKITGLSCPGCGSLRALHQLLHGRLAAALHFNALLVVSLPLLAWLAIVVAVRKLRQRPEAFTIRPRWLWWALATMVVFGVLRNLPVPQLAWLAP